MPAHVLPPKNISLSRPDDLDLHAFPVVGHKTWSKIWLAFDPAARFDWPRQRAMFAVSDSDTDSWQTVAEFVSFDGYSPQLDHIKSAELVTVTVEPAGFGPYFARRADEASANGATLDPDKAAATSPDGQDEQPLAHAPVGHRDVVRPSAAALGQGSVTALTDANRLVIEASRLVETVDYLRGWFRLPTPRTTPTKRGKGGRGVREFAEFAALFLHAAEVDPVAPVKWLTEEFDYTGYPATWWHALGNDLAKWGFIADRKHGKAGGVLTQRTVDELAAHRK